MPQSKIIKQALRAMQDPYTRTQLSTLLTVGFTTSIIHVLEHFSILPPSRFMLILLLTASYTAEKLLRQHGWDWPLGLCCFLASCMVVVLALLRTYCMFLASCSLYQQLIGAATSFAIAFAAYSRWAAGYKVFLSLGRGGTPYNALGYTVVSFKSWFGINPHAPPTIPCNLFPQAGFIDTLPERCGTRPSILGVAPQRQANQQSDPSLIQEVINRFTSQHTQLCQGRSFMEGHGTAIFPSCRSEARSSESVFGYEIGHVHIFDGSIHLNLHPADVATVIHSGWGERHPLARDDWWWIVYFRNFWQFWGYHDARPPVSVGWTLIYAPRNEEEQAIVMCMVAAAGKWMTS